MYLTHLLDAGSTLYIMFMYGVCIIYMYVGMYYVGM